MSILFCLNPKVFIKKKFFSSSMEEFATVKTYANQKKGNASFYALSHNVLNSSHCMIPRVHCSKTPALCKICSVKPVPTLADESDDLLSLLSRGAMAPHRDTMVCHWGSGIRSLGGRMVQLGLGPGWSQVKSSGWSH